MFKSWEDLSQLEQMACIYSDMYKDAYGFRPRNDTSSWTVEDFNQEFDRLEVVIQEENARLAQMEKDAIAQFEQRVVDVIAMGAGDRETAIRWIEDGEGASGDRLCYQLHLPYGYFAKG